MNIASILLILLGIGVPNPLVEIGHGRFSGDKEREVLYYKVIGPNFISLQDLRTGKTVVDLEFFVKREGVIDTIGTLREVHPPIKIYHLEINHSNRHKECLLLSDTNKKYYMIHRFETGWAISPMTGSFLDALTSWWVLK